VSSGMKHDKLNEIELALINGAIAALEAVNKADVIAIVYSDSDSISWHLRPGHERTVADLLRAQDLGKLAMLVAEFVE
jgi:hypothetical protein